MSARTEGVTDYDVLIRRYIRCAKNPMKLKFTPGPWLQDERMVYALNERGFNLFDSTSQDAHTTYDELVANATLMAAAPNMIAALLVLSWDMAQWHDTRPDEWKMKEWEQIMHKAIEKATGTAL